MRIHILGICGTFMAGVAVLAQQKGYEVSGCDSQVYPPMSDVLREAKIELIDHYDPDQLNDSIDLYVIGNAMKRGMPIIEAILNRGLPYVSGPQWLSEHILKERWVLAVAGTHGKTTTSSMLAWILEHTGFAPGFLIPKRDKNPCPPDRPKENLIENIIDPGRHKLVDPNYVDLDSTD